MFLAVHLYVNLLMLKGNDGVAYANAVNFMTTNVIIKIFEYVLFISFGIHILIGILLKLSNWNLRPVRYKVKQKSETSFFSRYMIWTGLVILTFLIIHFSHFFFIRLGIVEKPVFASDKHDFYAMAVVLFAQPVYSWFYIVCIAVLGFHLYHAFQSFFQTLGLSNIKYFGLIKTAGALYSVIISAGFIVIPVYFLYFY